MHQTKVVSVSRFHSGALYTSVQKMLMSNLSSQIPLPQDMTHNKVHTLFPSADLFIRKVPWSSWQQSH
jgi:hypothetical protein